MPLGDAGKKLPFAADMPSTKEALHVFLSGKVLPNIVSHPLLFLSGINVINYYNGWYTHRGFIKQNRRQSTSLSPRYILFVAKLEQMLLVAISQPAIAWEITKLLQVSVTNKIVWN